MKNNKGFTLVEIIVTFMLVSTISFLLFQLVLSLKDIYTTSDLKTVLLTKQGNMTRRINTDMFSKNLVSVRNCCTAKDIADGVEGCEVVEKDETSKKCVLFTLEDPTIEQNVTRKLEFFSSSIVYDGYDLEVNNGSTLGDVSMVVSYIEDASVKYNNILTIDMPITNKLVSGDFGIHVTIQYNSITADVNADILDDYRKIEIVTTTVSDITRRVVTTGDGIYTMAGEEWYDKTLKDLPKFAFRGEMPNNYVIFNKRCYRIMSVANDESMKLIYDGDADNGRCNIVDTSGSISKESWADTKTNLNNWFANETLVRVYTLPEWLASQNLNENRLANAGTLAGAVASNADSFMTILNQERVNQGSTSLPTKTNYLYSSKVALPTVADYILASNNNRCKTMADAVSTTNCKNENYLYKAGYGYWTINAVSGNKNNVWAVLTSGSLSAQASKTTTLGVRPVIYLKATTKFSGSGTTSDPYVVK